MDFASTIHPEPHYINWKAEFLTINWQMTKVTNTNLANTSHSTSWATVQKRNQRWLGQVYLQTGNEDSTVYARLMDNDTKNKYMRFVTEIAELYE